MIACVDSECSDESACNLSEKVPGDLAHWEAFEQGESDRVRRRQVTTRGRNGDCHGESDSQTICDGDVEKAAVASFLGSRRRKECSACANAEEDVEEYADELSKACEGMRRERQ